MRAKIKAEGDSVPSPSQQEIVLNVFLNCKGCERKVCRSLKHLKGVEEVIADCKSQKVVVKGNVDPHKVLEIVQKKSYRKVELISPIPKLPSEDEKNPKVEEKPKPKERNQEHRIVSVIKVYMHCEFCSEEIMRRVLKIEGIESVVPELKNSILIVKGAYDPMKLVEYVYKKTGKRATIVKLNLEKKDKEEEEAKEGDTKEIKAEEGEKETVKNEGGEMKNTRVEEQEEAKIDALKENQHFYNPASYGMGMYVYPPSQYSPHHFEYSSYPLAYPLSQCSPYPAAYPSYPVNPAYPPLSFYGENPNFCIVM